MIINSQKADLEYFKSTLFPNQNQHQHRIKRLFHKSGYSLQKTNFTINKNGAKMWFIFNQTAASDCKSQLSDKEYHLKLNYYEKREPIELAIFTHQFIINNELLVQHYLGKHAEKIIATSKAQIHELQLQLEVLFLNNLILCKEAKAQEQARLIYAFSTSMLQNSQ